jgi:hypothetical protein
MRHLSLVQRVEVIKERFSFSKLAPSTLFNLYKKHKIKYRKPKYSYLSKMRKADQIKVKQKKFVEKVTRLRMSEELIVYIDETTFNVWQIPSHVWARPDDLDVAISSKRGSSFTVIGAIDSIKGLRYYSVFNGTNTQQTFHSFLLNLKA